MKLLAVGGPRHGEELPFTESPTRTGHTLRVPIMPKVEVRWNVGVHRYCVHGEYVRSISDGDEHYIGAGQVADLYRLRPHEWRRAADNFHRPTAYCVYPRSDGNYARENLVRLPMLDDPTIKVGLYVTRVVSDRLVWVYEGE